MRIVVKKVGQLPEVMEIENELNVFHDIVGGHIECFPVFSNVLCVCNEEGKLKGLPVNFYTAGDFIVGDVFFCAERGEEFISLSDLQTQALIAAFSEEKY